MANFEVVELSYWNYSMRRTDECVFNFLSPPFDRGFDFQLCIASKKFLLCSGKADNVNRI